MVTEQAVCVTACEAGAVLAQCVLSRPVSPSHLYLNDATSAPSVTRNPGQKMKNGKRIESEEREKNRCDKTECRSKVAVSKNTKSTGYRRKHRLKTYKKRYDK